MGLHTFREEKLAPTNKVPIQFIFIKLLFLRNKVFQITSCKKLTHLKCLLDIVQCCKIERRRLARD